MNRTAAGIVAILALVALLALAGCGATETTTTTPPPADDGLSTGSRLAPGLYDLGDGTAEAVGTLQWIDLEGGFWAVIGGTEATGDVGTTIAVIANAAKDDPAYVALDGSVVRVVGERMSGVSVRMAGPEIEASSIEGFSDTPAAYE